MINTKKSLSLWIMFITLCIAIAGCGSKVKMQAIPADGVILAFGDSLTAGNGTTTENSYPAALERLSGHKVINAGISGETSTQGLERFSSVLDETNPSLVILMEGGNDILQSQDLNVTKQNLLQMIAIAQQKNIQVLLVGIPAKSIVSPSTANFYNEIAKQTKVAYDGETIAKLFKKPELKSDMVHFNTDGYAQIANQFYELLIKNGALKK